MHHIAFDLGNVLVDVDYGPFWTVSSELNIDEDSMRSLLNIIHRSEHCGLVKMKDVFEDELQSEKDISLLIEAWNSIIRPNPDMTNFVQNLSHEGFKIAYLSNIGSEHLNYLRTNHPEFMSYASVQHMSCEVGAAKPSSLYYQSFLMQNDDFVGAAYLDDIQENVTMGSKFKFDSIKFNIKSFDKQSSLKKRLAEIKIQATRC